MENPIWKLTAKPASAIACFLLFGGSLLALAAYLGLTGNHGLGLMIIFLGSAVAIYALAASHKVNAWLERQQKGAIEAANLLSQGMLLEDGPGGELMDSLRNVSDYLGDKAVLMDRFAEGKVGENLPVLSDADALGRSMHKLASSLRGSARTEAARERLHESVLKLLDDVSEVSAGDLTVKAHVGAEETGALADAFNSMTENLRQLIQQVKVITNQVGVSAGTIRENTEQLTRGSVVQGAQIARTTASMAKIAVQIQEVSTNAELSSKIASESLDKARSGTKAAGDNINAMLCVRKQVQETAKRVKRLGERSQEIGQIVALIDDLSDRTSLLALNASLQASAAGPAGAAFATVAEEVERLAERSILLTRQISTLTQTINAETKDVVASMEDTIHEVVIGSTLAEKSGKALLGIETTTNKLAELVRSISESAKYQAKSSEDISNAMASISEVTEIVETASRRASESVRSLVRLSSELQGSVSPFKLPPMPPNTVGDSANNDLFVN